MEVIVTPKKETSQAEIKVSVEAKDFLAYIEKAAKKLSTDHSIKGFRPGKAPVATVVEMFGQDKLLHEAMDLALPYFFVQAALDNGIEAINRPAITVEELGLDTAFRFTAIVDVLPEVTLPAADKIKSEKRAVKVDDELLEKELKHLARTRSTYLEVARPAKEGDVVTVDFTVKMDGEVMEGGTSKNHPITIGEGAFVPDFEKGLLGLTVGDTRSYPIAFPDDFANEKLRGKKAEVEVTAHAVQERLIPKLDDEFAKKIGKFESLQHLKDELKKNLTEELEHKEEERFHGELAEKLAEGATFGPIPEVLIEKEIDARLQELAQMLAYQGKNVDEYLNQQKKSMNDIRNDMKEAATKNVKVGLALRAFAAQEEVLVTDEEVEEKANQHLALYKTLPQAQANINLEDLKERVASTLRNQKTLKKLAELAAK
jgi:trigger factor